MRKKNSPQKSDFGLPSYEQELILSHILNKSREYVLAHPEIRLNKRQEQLFCKLASRRLKNEPLAYILGYKGFYGLDFKVTPDTLIPRPETEHLVDAVIGNLQLVTRNKNRKIAIIDVGTGSGNIIISIAKELEKSKLPITNLPRRQAGYQLLATDISQEALRVAKFNAKKYKLDNKIKFIKSDLLKYFIKHRLLNIKYLVIVANLPYLSKKIYNSAMPDVKKYESKMTLFGGDDGLNYYQKLFKQIKLISVRCSLFAVRCFLEFSPEQKNKIKKIVERHFPHAHIKFKKDLSQKWRIIIFKI